jgi:hypothetical protein
LIRIKHFAGGIDNFGEHRVQFEGRAELACDFQYAA